MAWLRILMFVLAMAAAAGAVARDPVAPEAVVVEANTFSILSYHEVRDDVRDYPDPYAADASSLVAQFSWLRANGYTPVSVDAILAARRGGTPLPAKALLLTFDDGYRSFYTRVYPLLLAFRFPAVLAVVGSWIDNPPGTKRTYGEKASVADAQFPTWGQIREMSASGLVEIASHSYDLHNGLAANPQGNLQPAATAREYDPAGGTHESDAAWRTRVGADLERNSRVIERETGRRPRLIAWPYGSFNGDLMRIAAGEGMPFALTLEDGANALAVPLDALRRILIEHNPPLADFIAEVRGPLIPEPLRVVQLSLDAIYHPDAAQQERNLSSLLDRVQALKPTHVFLEASTDSDGDGIADAAYFPTRHLPLRANLFNRAAWQLASRVDVKVFAVLPVSRFNLTPGQVEEVYADLARHANFEGLLFMADTVADITGFVGRTRRLADAARQWRGPLKIARGLSPGAAPATEGELRELEAASDFVVIVMQPEAAGPGDARTAGRTEDMALSGAPRRSLSRRIYMLGGETGSAPASGEPIARRMRTLQRDGALNFGYRGDDFLRDGPPFAAIAPALSLRIHPLRVQQ